MKLRNQPYDPKWEQEERERERVREKKRINLSAYKENL
jgi:hypothetical protein